MKKTPPLLLLLLVLGCSSEKPKKIYLRAEFEKEFMRADEATVRRKLGEPDRVIDTGNYAWVCWIYEGRTRAREGAQLDDRVCLCFNPWDEVYRIRFALEPVTSGRGGKKP